MASKFYKRSTYKKLYSSQLLFTAPKIYDTYQKMQYITKVAYSNQNTSQTSLETINNNPLEDKFIYNKNNKKNIKAKIKKQIFLKIIK